MTGRTHQIRVHLDAIGHPSPATRLRDRDVAAGPATRAGGAPLERLFLHAWRLQLTSPIDGTLIRAEAPLPDELERVLDGLRGTRPRTGRAA